ncbi:MAG: CHAD domain-containing protein [Pseudomonadota bacterium]
MSEASPRELELKLALDPAEVDHVRTSPLLRRLGRGRADERGLRSVYFDTADHALRKAGISVRIRTVDDALVQTVKAQTAIRGGISNPVEVEFPVAEETPTIDAIPNKALRKQISRLVGDADLKPVFETDMVRLKQDISRGHTLAELALDSGHIRTGEKDAPLNEAELELIAGSMDDFLAIADDLFADVPLKFSNSSKAERGYSVATGEPARPAVPVRAETAPLYPDMSAADAFRRITATASDQILRNWAAFLSNDDPECIHQLRIGLRRQRTALRVFRPRIDSDALRALAVDLRDAGRLVGEMRDKDVLIADIVRPVLDRVPETKAGAGLLDRLTADCSAHRAHLRRELSSARWNSFLLRVALLPHGALWPDALPSLRVTSHAERALDACWVKVRRRARRLEALQDAERHELRKDLKTLRYTVEFFSPLYPPKLRDRFLESLKVLQDSFGYLNDVVLSRTLPERLGEASEPDMHRVLGFVVGWHSALAEAEWADVTRRWRQLKHQKRFWT